MPKHIVERTYGYDPRQEKLFAEGKLAPVWRKRYPFLFDDADLNWARWRTNYHFREWLAAILLYESGGYYSVQPNYVFSKHRRKKQCIDGVLKAKHRDLWKFIGADDGADADASGNPDLFVYHPTKCQSGDWFFCETKRRSEHLARTQKERFPRLYQLTRKPVLVLRFEKVNWPGHG